jgi:hypothetical protein
MKMLVELLDDYSDPIKNDQNKINILKRINSVVNILFSSMEILSKVDSIDFISITKKIKYSDISDLFYEEIRRHEFDPSVYNKNDTYQYEIENTFLTENELNQITKYELKKVKNYIKESNLIKSIKDLMTKEGENESYICYLPHISGIHEDVIKLPNVYLIEDYDTSKVWNVNKPYIIEIDKRYLEINNHLKKLNNDKKPTREELDHIRLYKSQIFLHHWKDFYYELKTITEDDNRENKAYFHGEDYLLARRAITYFLIDKFDTINLGENLGIISKTRNSHLLQNIHFLNEGRLNRISEYLEDFEMRGDSIALQGLWIAIEDYLNEYKDIEIPDTKMIQSEITSLFITLLKENKIIKREEKDFNKIDIANKLKLNRAISNNSFFELLQNFKHLTDLNSVILKNMFKNTLSVDTLFYSATFWHWLFEKVDEKVKAREKNENELIEFNNRQNDEFKGEHDWHFEYKNNTWVIYKNTKELTTVSLDFIDHLVIIIEFHNLFPNEFISPLLLRMAYLKFKSEEITEDKLKDPSNNYQEKRQVILSLTDKRVAKSKEIKSFFNKHIRLKNKLLTVINSPQFTYEIKRKNDNFRFTKEFFNELKKMPEYNTKKPS